jgi:diguanylate cyclase (GGDEF)-like protein
MTTPLSIGSDEIGEVRRFGILDTEREAIYDDLCLLAARLCDTPYAAITFVDNSRCWFKSTVGFDSGEVDFKSWFCSQALDDPDEVTVVYDADREDRFRSCGLVAGEPGFRFYAGAPIFNSDGIGLGDICVLDRHPHDVSGEQKSALQAIARQIATLLDLRRTNTLLELSAIKMQMLVDRDLLTGLPSERMFRAQLRSEFQYSRRNNQPLSLVVLGVHGSDEATRDARQFGEILKKVSRVVSQDTRDYDLVARSGEDELAIVIRNAGSAGGDCVVRRLKTRIEATEFASTPVKVRFGVSAITPEMISSRDLIDRAREALHKTRKCARKAG